MYQKETELLKEMVDPKAGAGYVQDEPGTSCYAKKQESAKKKKNEGMS